MGTSTINYHNEEHQKLSDSEFLELIQSKTFFGACEEYDHPVFKSFKYAINYNEDFEFDETLYLFSGTGCEGRLSVLRTEGQYQLNTREDIEGFPTRNIDFRFTKSFIKVTDYKTKLKLMKISNAKNNNAICSMDLSKRYYEEFSLINKECFDLPLTQYNSREYNIIGLATDADGKELYLLSGDSENGYYHGLNNWYRPKTLDFSMILL